jgi:hypothetical protein
MKRINFYLTNSRISIIIVALFIFIFYSFIALRLNIHGDAKFHTLYAAESIRTGDIVQNQPYSIYKYDGEKRIRTPIVYPLSSVALFSLLFLSGGEDALKFYSPIFAVLIFLMIYLCIRELGEFPSIIISTFVVLIINGRLVMTPLIEPYMVFLLLFGVFCLKKYFQERSIKWCLLGSLFFGASAAIKQQGLAIMLFAALFLSIYFIWNFIKNKRERHNILIAAFGSFIILLIVPMPAFINQYHRNGTIMVTPGSMHLPKHLPFKGKIEPLVTSKFDQRNDALKTLNRRIGYNKRSLSISEKFQGFIFAPFLYYRANDPVWRSNLAYRWLGLLIIFVVLLNFLKKDKAFREQRLFWILILTLLSGDVLVSFFMQTPVIQYHTFGIVLMSTLVFSAIYNFVKGQKVLQVLVIASLFAIGLKGFINLSIPLWSDAGREDNYHIQSYKKIGNYVQNNTQSGSTFLAAETTFRYYARRDSIWANDYNADIVANIVESSDPNFILQNIHKLKVNYIVLDRGQINRRGLYDYIPSDGIFAVANDSKLLTKVYDPDGSGEIVVYKVNGAS